MTRFFKTLSRSILCPLMAAPLLLFPSLHIKAADFPVIDLSLNSAVLFALHKNPDIEIYMERYAQSISSIKSNEAGLYPQISATAIIGHEYNNPSSSKLKSDINAYGELSLGLEQLLFDGWETQHTIKRYENTSQSAFWTMQSQIEQTISNTVQLYLEILRYQENTKINRELITDIQKTIEYIQQQYDAGAADKVILDYATSRLASASTALNRSQSSLNDAISSLEFLTGKLPPKFTTSYPELLSPDKLDLQYYLKLSEQDNSSVIASEYEIEAAEHQLAAQRGRDLPQVNFVIDATESHNSGGEVGIDRSAAAFVRVDYTLFDGFKRRHAKNLIKSQINELTIRRERVLKEIKTNIKLYYNQLKTAYDSLRITEEEIKSSTALKFLNEENFKLGNINVIELIESAERLSEAKQKKVNLQNDMYLNGYRLLLTSSMIDKDFFCASCLQN